MSSLSSLDWHSLVMNRLLDTAIPAPSRVLAEHRQEVLEVIRRHGAEKLKYPDINGLPRVPVPVS